MSISKQKFSTYIKSFNFKELFNELGWDNDKTVNPLIVDDQNYTLQSVAEKSGFRIFICKIDGKLPDYALRRKIDKETSKLYHEHLTIFHNTNEQIWQYIFKQTGKPAKVIESRYNINQDTESLYQKASGLFFSLDEEDNITIIDVTNRLSANFGANAEKVTKKFYEGFKKEHTAFINFITGITDRVTSEWYASLMMNRLMFCYFIQKKGFLDNEKNYLKVKLNNLKSTQGKDQFYSFYRNFLLVLFHQGLGTPDREAEFKKEFGNIPYLNGGLFAVHEIEEKYGDIQIGDEAFERLFNFFDQYEWHLDTRSDSSGKEINPDVLGHIFEKYINDRAQMGAYYTKEDITDYISKNCIIPYLFDEVKRKLPKAFEKDAFIWQFLKESGDSYIYDAVKKGVPENDKLFADLPDEVQKGFNPELEQKIVDGDGEYLCELRKEWNRSAPSEIALPTEIYREVIERRKRCAEIRNKIKNIEIAEINDFITYNLNIRQFTQDVLENTTDAQFIMCFYKALNSVTILDPTCGSGAFLFAALNILEQLYEICLLRMENFVIDDGKGKHKYFEEVLNELNSPNHPNKPYFIYKSIILNNLYGVDIMKEAVEIAKLRLFLKLVATVDPDYKKPNQGLEPLPDIDFNIRAGNTLVGFATKQEIDEVEGMFVRDEQKIEIANQCDLIAKAFQRYKEIQLSYGDKAEDFKAAKDELKTRLVNLTDQLDKIQYLAIYGGHDTSGKDFKLWHESHQPFHWFAEFYEIIHGKQGFDVIIGNPPYVEYNKVKKDYQIKNYKTEKCGNLYGFVIERSFCVLNNYGLTGMIIPISAFSNASMESFQDYFKKFPLSFVSHYHQRPAALFEGVLQRLSIFITYKTNKTVGSYSTKVYRWKSETRALLFSNINYIRINQNHQKQLLKVGQLIESSIVDKWLKGKKISTYIGSSVDRQNRIFYRTAGGGYWVTILNTEFETTSLSNKSASFQNSYSSKVFSSAINSSLFWWYYSINYDQFNFKDYMIFGFKFTYPNDSVIEKRLIELSNTLEKELLANSTIYTINSKTRGSNKTITYNKYLSKNTMDQIDILLSMIFGFTHEELDFIINYDIKYRMSKELEGEDEL